MNSIGHISGHPLHHYLMHKVYVKVNSLRITIIFRRTLVLNIVNNAKFDLIKLI